MRAQVKISLSLLVLQSAALKPDPVKACLRDLGMYPLKAQLRTMPAERVHRNDKFRLQVRACTSFSLVYAQSQKARVFSSGLIQKMVGPHERPKLPV